MYTERTFLYSVTSKTLEYCLNLKLLLYVAGPCLAIEVAIVLVVVVVVLVAVVVVVLVVTMI